METKLIVTYVVCDDVVKNLGIKEDVQVKMNTAEIMTTAITAAAEYCGNFEKARVALKNNGAIPDMLSKSQFNRRLHRIKKELWEAVLEALGVEFAKYNVENEFMVDSFPVYACKLARQNQTKLFKNKEFIGYCAAKKEYFIGFKMFQLDLPQNARILADKAYNDYRYEDRLIQEKQVYLMPIRKTNSKRKDSEFFKEVRRRKRRLIETLFSCIERLMPRSIHVVTIAGLILKTMLFVLAYSFGKHAATPSGRSFETPTTSALRMNGGEI